MATGSCLCGAVTYEYKGSPMVTALCHCTDCQKWSGGAYTSNIVVPSSDFSVTKGKDATKSYKATGDSGKVNEHWFCSQCGSSLYTLLDVMPDAVCIKSGSIDDKSVRDYSVGVEFYCKDRLGYVKANEGAKQEPVFG